MITYDVDGVKMPKIKKRLINKWIKAVAATYGRKTGDIGYMFVDDEKDRKSTRLNSSHT